MSRIYSIKKKIDPFNKFENSGAKNLILTVYNTTDCRTINF